MILSLCQFILTIVLTVLCANAFSMSEGDIPIIALLIPALWILPQRGISGLLLLGGIVGYGYALTEQPIALSMCLLTLFPLLRVMFSKRSSIAVIATTSFIVSTLLTGIFFTQGSGKLAGSGWLTVLQVFSICAVWWSVRHWRCSKQHSWWSFGLLLPLWLAGLPYAVLVSLSITGIIASIETLDRIRNSINWNKLLCWTLPTVGFAVLVVSPNIEVPNSVFVVWMCMLGTAWMTDYILRSADEEDIQL